MSSWNNNISIEISESFPIVSYFGKLTGSSFFWEPDLFCDALCYDSSFSYVLGKWRNSFSCVMSSLKDWVPNSGRGFSCIKKIGNDWSRLFFCWLQWSILKLRKQIQELRQERMHEWPYPKSTDTILNSTSLPHAWERNTPTGDLWCLWQDSVCSSYEGKSVNRSQMEVKQR
jgi:hypothetical protein